MMASYRKRKEAAVCIFQPTPIPMQGLPSTRGTMVYTFPRPVEPPLERRAYLSGIVKQTENATPVLISK